MNGRIEYRAPFWASPFVASSGPFVLAAIAVMLVLEVARSGSPSDAKLLIFLLLGSLGAIAIRLLLRPLRDHGDMLASVASTTGTLKSDSATGAETSDDAKRYRAARWLYYLGIMTVAETAFRKWTFTLSDWIFLAALIALIFDRPRGKSPGAMPRRLLVGLGLLALGGLLASLAARDSAASTLGVAKYLYAVGVWLWMGTVTLRTVGQARTAVYCWLVSSAVTGAGAIAQIFLGIGFVVKATVAGRALGFTQHMNELGMVEAMAFLPAVIVLIDSRGWFWRTFGAGIVVAIAAGLLLSVSLSGLVGLAVATAIWAIGFLRPSRIKKSAVIISLAVVVAGLGLVFRSQSAQHIPTFFDRMQNVAEHSGHSTTVDSRLGTYSDAWKYISEHPFIGVGLDPADTSTGQGENIHNMILLQWFEGGFFSFLGIIVIFVTIFAITWRTTLEAASYPEFRTCLSLLLSTIAFYVSVMAAPVAHHRDAWIFAALPVVMEAQRKRRVVLHATGIET